MAGAAVRCALFSLLFGTCYGVTGSRVYPANEGERRAVADPGPGSAGAAGPARDSPALRLWPGCGARRPPSRAPVAPEPGPRGATRRARPPPPAALST